MFLFSEDLRRWLIAQELDLFRYRFLSLTQAEVQQFLQLQNLLYVPVRHVILIMFCDDASHHFESVKSLVVFIQCWLGSRKSIQPTATCFLGYHWLSHLKLTSKCVSMHVCAVCSSKWLLLVLLGICLQFGRLY